MEATTGFKVLQGAGGWNLVYTSTESREPH